MRKQREATCAEPSWREPEGGDGEPQLWNCLQRYQREPALPTLKPKPGGNSPKRDDAPEDGETEGVTLFLAHANGFPKQIWQPVLRHLFALYAGVDEVWLWETANHGDSALVNAGKLGDTFDWADNARDVLQFLQFHRPLPGQAELPLHLPPHALESTPRRVVGVGHSLGGGTLPSYFDALILVDPVIIADHIWTRRPAEIERYNALVRGALARRAVWGSRSEAKLGFLKSPFFQAWDPAALDAYVEYGLCGLPPATSSPSGASPRAGVMLKQSPYDEASVFCEPRAQAESWYLLPLLPARIELRWIMNGRSAAEATGGEEATRYTVWRRPANSSNVRVREAGHLIPQEAPGRLGEPHSHSRSRWREEGQVGLTGLQRRRSRRYC
ncbi:hypothetical protein CALCODRAFT_438552 [Calocera cornea HHB12733]|uniref:AB hydrolase-1 domain-containing protein n=1 Tax=Calocera cornea HHB12733 TaxID=1353952 RepID=A0A165EB30_9BASI|nr:hypothetical protein CALCODRAFT_438552 [Calocera cornea HHB12733]